MNCASSVLRLVIAAATVTKGSKAGEHWDCKTSQEKTQEQKKSRASCITTHIPCAIEAFDSPRMFPSDFSSCVTFAKVKLKKNIQPILTFIWKRCVLNISFFSLSRLLYIISALSFKYRKYYSSCFVPFLLTQLVSGLWKSLYPAFPAIYSAESVVSNIELTSLQVSQELWVESHTSTFV